MDDWLEKAQRQYRDQDGWHEGLTDVHALRFLRKNSSAVIHRGSDVSEELVAGWEQGLDRDAFWVPAKAKIAAGKLEVIRGMPRRLLDEQVGVTWAGLVGAATDIDPDDGRVLRRMLQHEYFSVYVREYNLQVLRGLPIGRVDFGTADPDPYYDFDCYRAAMKVAGLDYFMDNISARSMADLRITNGHAVFQRTHWAVTRHAQNARDVLRRYTAPLKGRSPSFEAEIARINEKRSSRFGVTLTSPELETVEERLLELARRAEQSDELMSNARSKSVDRSTAAVISKSHLGKPMPEKSVLSVLVFVSLGEELDILKSRWNLANEYGEPVWIGAIHGFAVNVLCAQGAGRVKAAVEIAHYLSRLKDLPDMIIVTGIAGGFGESDVAPGDVIVGVNVADLGTRKMRQGADGDVPEMRIEPFQCDRRIPDALLSGSFNQRDWANTVAEEFDYPKRSLPQLHVGTIVCVDEVVSSDDWRGQLLKAWPKAYGVEMESGGVMAAARRFGGVPVAVVRGVSDLANPLKADDEWRLRSARAACAVIERAMIVLHTRHEDG